MVHLLEAVAWPNAQLGEHWRSEIIGFLVDAGPPGPLPEQCPFTLDALLAADRAALEAQLKQALKAQLDADRHVV